MDPISPAAAQLSPEPWVEWGASQITLEGQTVCGDRHLLKPFAGGVLTAVVDGIGHGVGAAAAAQIALAHPGAAPPEAPLTLLYPLPPALKPARGAALSPV